MPYNDTYNLLGLSGSVAGLKIRKKIETARSAEGRSAVGANGSRACTRVCPSRAGFEIMSK